MVAGLETALVQSWAEPLAECHTARLDVAAISRTTRGECGASAVSLGSLILSVSVFDSPTPGLKRCSPSAFVALSGSLMHRMVALRTGEVIRRSQIARTRVTARRGSWATDEARASHSIRWFAFFWRNIAPISMIRSRFDVETLNI